jgi:hypothetical protein
MPSLNADETATLRRYYDNVIGLANMTRQPIESIPSLATVAENADIRQLIREDRLATARARNGDDVYVVGVNQQVEVVEQLQNCYYRINF